MDTLRVLARHVRKKASEAGYSALAQAGKATIQRILAAQAVQPHKVKYYLERRDPDFERKMREVLMVYQEVALQNGAAHPDAPHPVITVSVDEKPGVQAIGNTAPDLPPVAGQHPTVARDHEYIRYGTWSILPDFQLRYWLVQLRALPTYLAKRGQDLCLDRQPDHEPRRPHVQDWRLF